MKKLTPVISVVIPAYNEQKRIVTCISALQKQQFHLPYEIIICDNNSADETKKIAIQHKAIVVTEKRKGYAHALHAGVSRARAPIILITDADVIVPKYWVKTYYDFFQNNPSIQAASGPFIFTRESPFMHTITKICNDIYPRILVTTLVGMNMGFRKTAYDAVGGFDTRLHLSADSYLGTKIKRIGKIGFIHMEPVTASGRRFSGFLTTLKEGIFRWCNYHSLRFFDYPLVINFRDIR